MVMKNFEKREIGIELVSNGGKYNYLTFPYLLAGDTAGYSACVEIGANAYDNIKKELRFLKKCGIVFTNLDDVYTACLGVLNWIPKNMIKNRDYKQEYLQEWQMLYYPKQWKENVDKMYGHNLTYEKDNGDTRFTPKIKLDDKGVMWCSIETGVRFKSIQVDVCFLRKFCDEVYYYRQQGVINSQEQYKNILEVCIEANKFLSPKSDVVSNVSGMNFIDGESEPCNNGGIGHNTINDTKTYLMKNKRNGFYKIGRSNNPKRRERTLQSEEPDIVMVKVWGRDIEKELHRKYDKHRLRGEWFDLNKIQVKYICTNY